jgi:hypothetical protein
MPVPSQGHCGFHSFPVVDLFCLFVDLWVLPFLLEDCSVFDNFVITLIVSCTSCMLIDILQDFLVVSCWSQVLDRRTQGISTNIYIYIYIYLMVRTLQCRCIYLWPGYVDHGYVRLVVTLPGPFLYSWLITRFVTRVTRWMPLVEYLSSPTVFSGVRVTRSLVFCVIFCRSLFGLSFYLRILIAPFGISKLLLDYMCMDIYTRVTVHNW